VEFSAGAKGYIQVIQIFLQAAATVPFSDISGDTVNGINTIGDHLPELKWETYKCLASQDVEGYRILPDSELLVSSIYVLSIHREDWKDGIGE
jgi:hypothetical protein